MLLYHEPKAVCYSYKKIVAQEWREENLLSTYHIKKEEDEVCVKTQLLYWKWKRD